MMITLQFNFFRENQSIVVCFELMFSFAAAWFSLFTLVFNEKDDTYRTDDFVSLKLVKFFSLVLYKILIQVSNLSPSNYSTNKICVVDFSNA